MSDDADPRKFCFFLVCQCGVTHRTTQRMRKHVEDECIYRPFVKITCGHCADIFMKWPALIKHLNTKDMHKQPPRNELYAIPLEQRTPMGPIHFLASPRPVTSTLKDMPLIAVARDLHADQLHTPPLIAVAGTPPIAQQHTPERESPQSNYNNLLAAAATLADLPNLALPDLHNVRADILSELRHDLPQLLSPITDEPTTLTIKPDPDTSIIISSGNSTPAHETNDDLRSELRAEKRKRSDDLRQLVFLADALKEAAQGATSPGPAQKKAKLKLTTSGALPAHIADAEDLSYTDIATRLGDFYRWLSHQ